jgi:isocitrate dehydrogenase (NAD+)
MIGQCFKKFNKTLLQRSFSTQKNFRVTLFPGDGIGPEISQAVIDIFSAAQIPVEWEYQKIHTKAINAAGDLIGPEALESVRRNTYALKGPFETPIGKGHRSLNVTLRKKLNLYVNLRPCKSIIGIKGPYENIDVVTLRENTEGEYSGLEHEVVPGVVENLKIISEKACRKIAEYAFVYATKNNRKTVTACHKAGISAMADGLFIRICREESEKYPSIKYQEEQVDTVAMKLAQSPELLDVMVMPNLYGDIISDLCAGLIGGLGLTASGNIGEGVAIYEAVHGSAPDIAGKNLANPTALLLSSVMMLDKMEMFEDAARIKAACFKVYEEGKYTTGDVGGKSTTSEFTKAVIGYL